MTSKQYIQELSEAAIRTATEKYLLPAEMQVLGKYKPYRSNDTYEAIYQLFIKRFGEIDGTVDLTKVKGQCLNFHFQMSSVIRQLFDVPTILTIGYVTFLDQDFYKFETVNSHLVRQMPGSKNQVIDIHAWLTFPSFEILDLTFMAHYHYVKATPETKEKLKKATDFPYYFGSADNLYKEENIIYHPKYIGEDVLRKNGFLIF